MTRSTQLAVALVAAILSACGVNHSEGPPPPDSTQAAGFLDTLEERTFHYFWDLTNSTNGLTPDRSPTPPFSSIAAVGFALTAYPIGVERGYTSRAQAAARTLTTLRLFATATQDSSASGATGYHVFFYHFLDMSTGKRYQTVEKVIEEPVIAGGAAGARVLRGGREEAQRRERSGGRLGAAGVPALHTDRVGGEGEAHGRDAREGRGRGPVGREPVGAIGQVPEVVERALLEGIEEAGGLGGVGRGWTLGVVDTAPREDRRGESGGELCATRHAGRISLRSPDAGHRCCVHRRPAIESCVA